MKRWVKRLLIAVVVSVSFMFTTMPAKTLVTRAGFNITHYDVQVNVNSDGTFDITETLDVTFHEKLHGIYFDIPTKYEMNWDNGNIMKYSFPVTDVKVLSGHDNEIEKYDSAIRIILGSPNRYSSIQETYKVSYKLHTKDLDLDGVQMLFYNIISGGWNCDIEYVTFNINLPESVDFDKLYFDSPAGVTQISNGPLLIDANGTTIRGSYNSTLSSGEALTIQLFLPNDYFKFPTTAVAALTVSVIGAIITFVCYFLFLKYGKDERLIPVVEFDAPAGMTSAEVGYVIDGICDSNDVASLIIFWAKKGCLSIEDDGTTLTLTKLTDLPDDSRDYEFRMFSALFDNRNVVTTEQLSEKFYTHINKAQRNIYDYFKKGNKVYTSEGIQMVLAVISGFPLALLAAISVFHMNFDFVEAVIAGIGIAVIVFLATGFLISLSNSWYTLKAKPIIMFVTALLSLAAFIATYVVTQVFGSVSIQFLIITTVSTVILMFVAAQMRKRTRYGSEMMGRVLGLRTFIITAEKERLEMLLKDNPSIFYDILPFAYALSLTDIWSKHFKELEIAPCDWYNGGTVSPYLIGSSMSSSMNSLTSSMVSAPAPEGGSGGGSSSGGDSGFSGGGFGGSSGGGW